MADDNLAVLAASRALPQKEVHEESRSGMIMADEIDHQHVYNVRIESDTSVIWHYTDYDYSS